MRTPLPIIQEDFAPPRLLSDATRTGNKMPRFSHGVRSLAQATDFEASVRAYPLQWLQQIAGAHGVDVPHGCPDEISKQLLEARLCHHHAQGNMRIEDLNFLVKRTTRK